MFSIRWPHVQRQVVLLDLLVGVQRLTVSAGPLALAARAAGRGRAAALAVVRRSARGVRLAGGRSAGVGRRGMGARVLGDRGRAVADSLGTGAARPRARRAAGEVRRADTCCCARDPGPRGSVPTRWVLGACAMRGVWDRAGQPTNARTRCWDASPICETPVLSDAAIGVGPPVPLDPGRAARGDIPAERGPASLR